MLGARHCFFWNLLSQKIYWLHLSFAETISWLEIFWIRERNSRQRRAWWEEFWQVSEMPVIAKEKGQNWCFWCTLKWFACCHEFSVLLLKQMLPFVCCPFSCSFFFPFQMKTSFERYPRLHWGFQFSHILFFGFVVFLLVAFSSSNFGVSGPFVPVGSNEKFSSRCQILCSFFLLEKITPHKTNSVLYWDRFFHEL